MNAVTLLGTKGGPAIRPGSPMPSSSLIELGGTALVVDAGLGVTRALCDAGMALADLRHVAITHLHSDHYLELGALIHTAWTAGLRDRVTVWGPPGLAAAWAGFLTMMEADVALRVMDEGRPDLAGLVTIRVLRPGEAAAVGNLTVEALRVPHPPIADCLALSVRSAGRHVVMGADTAYHPPLAEFAAGADLLVHEAMLEAAIPALVARVGNGDDRLERHLRRAHTAAADAGRIAAAAGVGALALNHLLPADDPDYGPQDWAREVRKTWNGPLHVGTDGLRIEL
ncbi:MAG: MBL fold metallo-hydrolase [Paracoccaceae bacterium]